MRHLSDSSIRVLPVLVDACEIPALIADIRYADCRTEKTAGFRELLAAIKCK